MGSHNVDVTRWVDVTAAFITLVDVVVDVVVTIVVAVMVLV